MPDQIGREDLKRRREPLGERGEMAPVARDAMQTDDARCSRISPFADGETLPVAATHGLASAAAGPPTSSSRRVPGSLTSDQITVPFLSIRNVPRTGAPVFSLNTP